jgi:hypothetical protein
MGRTMILIVVWPDFSRFQMLDKDHSWLMTRVICAVKAPR